MKPAYLIAFALLIGSAAATMFAFSNSVARHVTIPEAKKKVGQTVQVPGDILKETVKFDGAKGELRFDIKEKSGPNRLTIVYNQAKPDTFDTALGVEAIGTYNEDGTFHANNLLLKCPSKYSDEPENKPNAPAPGKKIRSTEADRGSLIPTLGGAK